MGSSATRRSAPCRWHKDHPLDLTTGNHYANGEIWSAALWNIYRAIGGDSINPADHEAARRAFAQDGDPGFITASDKFVDA